MLVPVVMKRPQIFALICAALTLELTHASPADGLHASGPLPRRIQDRSKQQEYNQPNDLSGTLKLAKEMSTINDIEGYLNMMEGVPQAERVSLLTGNYDGERSNADIAKPATCMPELTSVPFKDEKNHDPSIVYLPPCTRINRCGGCCSHSLLSCQPIATEIRNFKVLVSKIEADTIRYQGKEIIPLVEHTRCKCDCRIKEEDCTEKQTYQKDECRCVCTNIDEEEKCSRNNQLKLWDPNLCSCYCRNYQECATGWYFDQNSCSCRKVPLSRTWFTDDRTTSYNSRHTPKSETPPVIVHLDAADPRRKPKDDPEYK